MDERREAIEALRELSLGKSGRPIMLEALVQAAQAQGEDRDGTLGLVLEAIRAKR